VRFYWFPENVAHVACHGLTPSDVEAIFEAKDLRVKQERPGRWMAEGTVAGRTFRVVYGCPGPDEIYVATAYRVHPTRRKTT
jgi:hypothetical protein